MTTRSIRSPLPLLALLAGTMLPSPALAVDSPSVYIQKHVADTDHPTEKAWLNQEIDHLKSLFSALPTSDSRDAASYAIFETRFELTGDQLEVSAKFKAPGRPGDPFSGTGASPKPRMKVSMALNDYLDQTLFDPRLGAYPRVRIETCDDSTGRLLLVTSWTDRLAFEHKFSFEIGQEDPIFQDYSGTGVFLKIVKSRVNGSRATLGVGNLVRTDGSAVKETCADTGLGHDLARDPRYLLMRIYAPEAKADGRGHDALLVQ